MMVTVLINNEYDNFGRKTISKHEVYKNQAYLI